MNKEILRASDIMEILDVKETHAYKIIRDLNKELENQGYEFIPGRVSRDYFFRRYFGFLENEVIEN